MIHLNILGQDIIILDSLEAVMDLLERRSSIYSDRPKIPMITELMGFDFSLLFVPYGKCWNRAAQLYDAQMALTRKPMVKSDALAYLSANINLRRSQRKLMHLTFHPAAAKNFRPHILKTTHSLLRRLVERPGNLLSHVRQ